MQTRILTFAFTFILSLTLFSQITISGKVLGKHGKPLKEVSVTLKDTYVLSTARALLREEVTQPSLSLASK